MVNGDDKYAGDEENLTQVRSIIKHLNEDKPSQERAREVVVRADGSKVVRVTRKRKVMLTMADKRRKSRRHILFFVAACLLLSLLCGALLFFRMATMSSSAYVEQKCSEMQQLWGATNLLIEGAGLNGTSLNLSSIVAEFPEDSMLQRVELNGVHASLDMMTYVNGRVVGAGLNIERAHIVLRKGAKMLMPLQNGADLWRFARMDCKDFSVTYTDASEGPVNLKHAQAYMYYPSRERNAGVVMLRGGSLDIRGWRTVRITEGKAHVSRQGVDDFFLSGTTDIAGKESEQRRTTIAIAGKLSEGEPLAGSFSVEGDNMKLADFTDGRFEEFFTARTCAVSRGKLNGKFLMSLDEDGAPRFAGELHLRNICLSSFPALMALTEHMEHNKRHLYNPVSLERGYVRLENNGESVTVEIPRDAIVERDLAMLTGRMVLNAANELSGEMNYGIPVVLTRVEYPDGHPDPIFQQSGEWAVLRTNLRGYGNMPGDDMAEVEARASIARRERPARMPFSQVDVNRLTEQLLQQNAPGKQEVQPVQETPAAEVRSQQNALPVQQSSPFVSPLESGSNPFETREDPFAPSTPF